MATLKPKSSQTVTGMDDLTVPRISRPSLRRKPYRKTGPRLYRLDKDPEQLGGPGDPPPEFLSGKTSASEWYFYWAMSKIWDVPSDPRVPPFEGDHGGIWAYQKYFPIMGITGKTNVDFVYYGAGYFIGIRVQSERFHLMTDARQYALDDWLASHNFGVSAIIDVYEHEALGDPTGAAAIAVMARACRGLPSVSPLILGNTFRARRPPPPSAR